MNRTIPAIVAILTCSLAGCSDRDGFAEEIQQVRSENAQLKLRLEALEYSLNALDEKLTPLRSKWAESNFAFLKADSKSFALINSDAGPISFSIDDIAAYGPGTKLKLVLGNTTSATLEDVKFTADWGPLDSHGLIVDGKTKSKEVAVIRSLERGRWAEIEVILDGVPPSEFGFLRVKDLRFSAMKLLKQTSQP